MKYRNIIIIASALALLALSSACKKEQKAAAYNDFTAESTTVSVPLEGFSETAPGVYEFTTTQPWSAKLFKSASWFTFSPAKGEAGKNEIRFTASDNSYGRTRTATLTIVSGLSTKDITFTQTAHIEGQPWVDWENPVQIAPNPAVYGRVHRLSDDRLMACYSTGQDSYIKFSSDEGASWDGAKCIYEHYDTTQAGNNRIVKIDNPDFAQLSSSNPYKPDRIIYAVNERVRTVDEENPENDDKDAFPYYISVLTSDDGGETWSDPVKIYSSSEYAGCYEPFVLELPDGTVQVYFADETPYASASGIGDQNVTVVESTDGGQTWGTARVASYCKGGRDGMPAATVYNGNIYLTVEYRSPAGGEDFHPVVVYNSVSSSWSSPVGDFAEGTPRFDPFQTSLQPAKYFNGAPYIAQTDNFFLISYQTNRTPSGATASNSDLEIQICPKSEMSGAVFNTMRSASRPAGIDMTKKYANWNSISGIGGDTVMAVYCSGGCVYGVKGTVRNE